jgi:hypothetical protein
MLKQRAQTTEPKLEHRNELPLHICKLPLSQSMQEGHLEMHDKEQTKLTLPKAVRPPAQAVRPPTTHLTASGPVRPPHVTGPKRNCSKFARSNWNTFQRLPGAQSMHKLLPLVDKA